MRAHESTIGYCTNVHAGTSISEIKQNLERYAVRVREQVDPQRNLGIGLWLPNAAAVELDATSGAAEAFSEWLEHHRLEPYTVNGFPFDNFHMPVVKHRVYLPTWWQPERFDYTMRLFRLLHRLIPANKLGSISTLPISWRDPHVTEEQLKQVSEHLKRIADHLRRVEDTSGRRMVLAIEPEPGCYLQTTADVIAFFDRWVPQSEDRRYITVCHDVCHAAVMNEQQSDSMRALREAGIGIGKVQVSSAIEVNWRLAGAVERGTIMNQLRGFAEDRYLHQTGCVRNDGTFELFDDLPMLIEHGPRLDDHYWRIHFHMPIHLSDAGPLGTTQSSIHDCFRVLGSDVGPDWTGHYEVETYAWSVLPAEHRPADLASGIAEEIRWLRRINEEKPGMKM